jgi:hypothetical protein
MRKLDGANGTKALEKADELQRPETKVAKRQNDPRRKISFLRKLQQKFVTAGVRAYKKGRKAALAWKKEVISSSSPSVVVSSFRIKARAPKAVKVCFWSLESIIFGISL